tara:strand:- start:4260 stop:5381 length:1122 start_codon:yes stop_codon:yes gene_type:complete
MSSKRILVTGGAGFIGSAVIRHIIENTNDTVVNVDKLTYAGNLESLTSIASNKRYFFEQVDICDRLAMRRLLTKYKPCVIMHLAAESHVDRSIDGPSDFIETNILGTFVLLEAAREYWNNLDEKEQALFRFHHISTDEVFGDLEGTNDLFTEKSSYNPSSPYSASKAASDHLVRAWLRTYGLPTIVTNCSNNYGPYHFPEKLIPLTIINAISGKKLPIYGNGKQVRDWLYVEDHANALYLVATKGDIGGNYNVGGHNEKTNIEVVTTICGILDELVPVNTNTNFRNSNSTNISKTQIVSYSELITFVDDRPGHDVRYAIDASEIERKLGWTPQETFSTGIRKTVEWYLKNETWWRRVLDGSYNSERLGLGRGK